MNGILRWWIRYYVAGDLQVAKLISEERVIEKVRGILKDLPWGWKILMTASLFIFRFTHSWLGENPRGIFVGFRFLFLTRIYSEPDLMAEIGYLPSFERRQRGEC